MKAIFEIDCYKIAYVIIKSKAQCIRDDAHKSRTAGETNYR